LPLQRAAEVVGSNPTRSTFTIRVTTALNQAHFRKLSDKTQQQCQCRILPFVRHPDTIHVNAEAETNDMGM
jgi:REP element-mobilizing transposase RayT